MSATVLPRLVVLTDRHLLPAGRDLRDQLAHAVAGGLTHVVLRELDLPDDDRTRLAADLLDLGLRVVAAHRPVPGACGVHLPAAAPAPEAGPARHRSPWGRSCHSAEEVRRAAAAGAAWTTLSPFNPTPSKPGYGPSVPRADYAHPPVPTYALGGIGPDDVAAALAAGAHGVAVMGAVMRADDPADVVRALRDGGAR